MLSAGIVVYSFIFKLNKDAHVWVYSQLNGRMRWKQLDVITSHDFSLHRVTTTTYRSPIKKYIKHTAVFALLYNFVCLLGLL